MPFDLIVRFYVILSPSDCSFVRSLEKNRGMRVGSWLRFGTDKRAFSFSLSSLLYFFVRLAGSSRINRISGAIAWMATTIG
jgi:hypothetical protein